HVHHGVDALVILEQLARLPHQPVELGHVEWPEAAEQHELLRRRDSRDRIHLQEPEAPDRVEHAVCTAVEELRPHGDASSAVEARRLRHVTATIRWALPGKVTSPGSTPAIVTVIGAFPAGTPTGNQP